MFGLDFVLQHAQDGGFLADMGALLALAGLEIALGIDNIVFLAIVTGKLPPHQQPAAQRVGLLGAMLTRILLLTTVSWLAHMTEPLFTLWQHPWSVKDLILFFGGLYLIWKGVKEMHERIEAPKRKGREPADQLAFGDERGRPAHSFGGAIVQIAIIDIVFSLDSVITAVGIGRQLWIMITAIVLAVLVIMFFASPVTRLIKQHPTLEILALAFILLVGVFLVLDAMGQHVEKGYLYFGMAFAFGVEFVNLWIGRNYRRYGGKDADPGAGGEGPH